MNIQSPDPQKLNPTEAAPDSVPVSSVESTPAPSIPENLTPPTAEVPAQTEIDHLSTVAVPTPTQTDLATNDEPDNDDKVAEPIVEPNDTGDLDKKYFKAADEVTETLAEKPYEEEERAEDLSQGYLHDRFGKDIKKSEE